jgi:hypothetical protein
LVVSLVLFFLVTDVGPNNIAMLTRETSPPNAAAVHQTLSSCVASV